MNEPAAGDYRLMLEELLAEIHRDGGQYTKLVGLKASLEDAHKKVRDNRRKLSSMMFKTRKM